MVSASATYFYRDDHRSTDLSHERRWRPWEVSSSAAAAWQWLPAPAPAKV